MQHWSENISQRQHASRPNYNFNLPRRGTLKPDNVRAITNTSRVHDDAVTPSKLRTIIARMDLENQFSTGDDANKADTVTTVQINSFQTNHTSAVDTPDRNTLLMQSAVKLVEQGLKVTPVHGLTADGHCTCPAGEHCKRSQSKHPAMDDWQNTGNTMSADVAALWWGPGGIYEGYNIGVLMGGGWLCFDCDENPATGKAGIEQFRKWVAERPDCGIDIDSPTQITPSGGTHYVCKVPAKSPVGRHIERDKTAELYGVDILGEGSYIIVGPSCTPVGCYQWVGAAPQDLPALAAPVAADLGDLTGYVEGAVSKQRRGRRNWATVHAESRDGDDWDIPYQELHEPSILAALSWIPADGGKGTHDWFKVIGAIKHCVNSRRGLELAYVWSASTNAEGEQAASFKGQDDVAFHWDRASDGFHASDARMESIKFLAGQYGYRGDGVARDYQDDGISPRFSCATVNDVGRTDLTPSLHVNAEADAMAELNGEQVEPAKSEAEAEARENAKQRLAINLTSADLYPLHGSISFPVDALPQRFKRCVLQVADEVAAPAEMAVGEALFSAAAAMQATARVQIGGKVGSTPLSYHHWLVGSSGIRKTSVAKYFREPREAHYRDIRIDYGKRKDVVAIAFETWATEDTRLKREINKAKDATERAALQAEREKHQHNRPLEAKAVPHAIGGDLSAEGAIDPLKDCPVLIIEEDEGGVFLKSHAMDKNNRPRTLGVFNKGWNHGNIGKGRSGGGTSIVFDPRAAAVSVSVGVQPSLFNRYLMDDDDFRTNGLLARSCVMRVSDDIKGTRLLTMDDLQQDAVQFPDIYKAVAGFHQLGVPALNDAGLLDKNRFVTLNLSSEALPVWLDYYNYAEREQKRATGKYRNDEAGIASKTAELAARIAGLLHIWRHMLDCVDRHLVALKSHPVTEFNPATWLGFKSEICREDMEAGAALARYFMAQAMALQRAANGDDDTRHTEFELHVMRTLDSMQANHAGGVIDRQVIRQDFTGNRKTPRLDATMAELEEQGVVTPQKIGNKAAYRLAPEWIPTQAAAVAAPLGTGSELSTTK